MNCKNCFVELKKDHFFCNSCGAMVAKNIFADKELQKDFEKRMSYANVNIKNSKHNRIRWNDNVNDFVQTLEKISTLLKMEEFENDAETNMLLKRIDSFQKRCKNQEFHIAFVGTIKSGKSTLINSILGRNYDSTSVTPETAVLTKFRKSNNNYVHVEFYNEKEWSLLWRSISNNADVFLEEYENLKGNTEKNNWIGKKGVHITIEDNNFRSEIEKWTSSNYAAHYFVKEVEVGIKDLDISPDVVFVDTPGLNDTVQYRSNVTKKYIDRANVVFVCVKSDSLTSPEMKILYKIFANTNYNPEKVHVIGTQYDSLNSPIKDWHKQKAEWVKYLSGNNAFGSKELAIKNITCVAAYINNLVKDYENLTEDELWNLRTIAFKFKISPNEIENKKQDLITISNINNIKSIIDKDILSKYTSYMLVDIEETYAELIKDLRFVFNYNIKEQRETINTTKKNLNKINTEYITAKTDVEEVKAYRKHLISLLTYLKYDTEQRIDKLTDKIKKIV